MPIENHALSPSGPQLEISLNTTSFLGRYRGSTRGGLVYLVPSYTEKRPIEVPLQSIADQVRDPHQRTSIVVVNNGFPAQQGRKIYSIASAMGLPLEIVDVYESGCPRAKDGGLTYITERGRMDPDKRPDGIIILDDDCALAPGTERKLTATAQETGAAIVTTRSSFINGLNLSTYGRLKEEFHESEDNTPAFRLPSLIGTDGIDMTAIVAFSGMLIMKGNCSWIDAGIVNEIMSNYGMLHIPQFPNGSMNDVYATLITQRHGGEVYHHSGAVVWDAQRENLASTFQQQSRWAHDHVVALNDFYELGLAKSGIRILEPEGDQWSEYLIPSDSTGILINTKQLISMRHALSQFLDHGDTSILPLGYTPTKLQMGITMLDNIFDFVGKQKINSIKIPRPDLPHPAEIDQRYARNRVNEGGIARLAGNIMGLYNIFRTSATLRLPSVFLFGMRQGGVW